MSVKKEPAVCSGGSPKQTASNNQLLKPYLRTVPESRFKLAIGEMLLFGNKKRKEFWPLFEALLVHSYASVPQIPRQSVDKAPEWTISHRPE